MTDDEQRAAYFAGVRARAQLFSRRPGDPPPSQAIGTVGAKRRRVRVTVSFRGAVSMDITENDAFVRDGYVALTHGAARHLANLLLRAADEAEAVTIKERTDHRE